MRLIVLEVIVLLEIFVFFDQAHLNLMQGVELDLPQNLTRVRVDLDHAHVVLHAGPDVPFHELQLSYATLLIIFRVMDIELAYFLMGFSIDASYGLRAIGDVVDVLSWVKSNASAS